MDPQPLPANIPRMSFEDFLLFKKLSLAKHEYYAGVAIMMPSGDMKHAEGTANWLYALASRSHECRCKALGSGMGIWSKAEETAVYPDASLYCGKPQFRDESEHFATNPTLVVEVMSNESRDHDLTFKAALYRGIASLQQYLCMDTQEVRIHCWTKHNEWEWQKEEFTDLAAEITILALGKSVRVGELYQGLL